MLITHTMTTHAVLNQRRCKAIDLYSLRLNHQILMQPGASLSLYEDSLVQNIGSRVLQESFTRHSLVIGIFVLTSAVYDEQALW